MGTPPEYIYGPFASDPLATPRLFKKHKLLPRPPGDRDRERQDGSARDASVSVAADYNLIIDTSVASKPNSQNSSPRTLKHQSRRISSGPDLPPTPPSHSRTSSSSHSTSLQQPTASTGTIDGSLQPTPQPALRKPPVTPPDQRSPPTPDVTPPKLQPALRPLRPPPNDRSASGTTPTESRTDSFTTAREEQISSDDEAGRAADMTSHFGSGQTSQTTILRIPETNDSRLVHPQALDAALGRLNHVAPDSLTPRTRTEFGLFDGEWPQSKNVQKDRQQEHEQDYKHQQAVTSRRKRPSPKTPVIATSPASKRDVIEDNLVTPTPAAKAAVRQMQLRDTAVMESSPVSSSVRSVSETSASVDARRSSATSARSSASAMVEVLVMDRSPQLPQRQRTLRHVKKQHALRGASDPAAPKSPESDSLESHRRLPQPKPSPRTTQRVEELRQRGRPKSNDVPPMSNGKTRRDVWSQGGIPVVVVPDRQSSNRVKSREPSLRSTSSRRSRRTDSIVSSQQVLQAETTRSGRGSRRSSRGRAASLPRRGDERTMDYPPVVPPRSSSLSAPTSRNGSRSGSLTAESIRAHNELMQSQQKAARGTHELEIVSTPAPAPPLPAETSWKTAPTSPDAAKTAESRGSFLDPDHNEDSLSMKKYSSRNTPFSIVSIDTMGTAPEVSEAQAVHMYPHQNSSLLMVDSTRPSEASDRTGKEDEAVPSLGPPVITTTGPDGSLPVTPPDQQGTAEDVDSPLRNPRAPPEPPTDPPAINFIPATPSGITPADEKRVQLGNYFEVAEQGTARRPSFVRRAFSRRRHSIDLPPSSSKAPGLLTRTFSLSRHVGLGPEAMQPKGKVAIDGEPSYPHRDERPADVQKLHPFWRPQYDDDDYENDCELGDDCPYHTNRGSAHMQYPLIDNRPRGPKRTLSERVKNTFAILPAKEHFQYPQESPRGPDLRTIRRTPSGSLRVMPRRGSTESLRRARDFSQERPPPVERNRRWGPFARSSSTERPPASENRRRFSLSGRLENLPNIPQLLNERRREKRTQELRQMISGPTEVRDGVGEVIRRRGIQAA
ncbi:hypothetical protein K4F52_000554 [Lecanicillium sp. MT-2017a]|nr:hypothetical protein K4F52_000554 [Lecanicillium sp. MT-2017a]